MQFDRYTITLLIKPPDAPRDAEDRREQRELRQELRQRREPVPMGRDHREQRLNFRIHRKNVLSGRVRVEARQRSLLQPLGGTRQVVAHAVPVVRRCRDDEERLEDQRGPDDEPQRDQQWMTTRPSGPELRQRG